jgi:hypothetical protein
MTELEQRYAALLRLYPAAYRRARGAEMLAVLMESATPGRRRPEWREVGGLILGALRVRTGAQGHRTPGQSWRVALRTAALILLVQAAGTTLWQMLYDPDGTGVPAVRIVVGLAVTLVCGGAVAAILRGAHLIAAITTAAAFALQVMSPDLYIRFTDGFITFLSPSWQVPLALALLIPLIGRDRVSVPPRLNLLLIVPVVSVALDGYGTLMREPAFQTGGRAVWQTLAVVAILWSIVDERVAMTLGLAFFGVVVDRAILSQPLAGDWSTWQWTLADMAILAILPLLDVAVGAAVAVRRARI